jgi:ubiquinone/menaquinone biosynthesis C-methylase UbiE
MKVKYGWNPDYPKPSYWNDRTPLYIGMPKFFLLYQDLNDKKLRVFFKKLRGKVLDAGCGDGRFIEYADVGVDFSRGMLNRAKKRHPYKDYIRASILQLPFKDKVFSSAFTVDVLLHIPSDKREQAIKEIGRVSASSYHFIGEHRSCMPIILELLRNFPFKWFKVIIPYITVFLAFPLDRLKQLEIEPAYKTLKRLLI